MVGSSCSGSGVLGKHPCLHPVPALEILLRFGCDQKFTGDARTSLCSLSEADNTSPLVGFSFPLLEKKPEKEKKKTEKEKKKSKKASLEEVPVADGSAEVHKKKKKVCTTPWAVMLFPAGEVPGWRRNRAISWPC